VNLRWGKTFATYQTVPEYAFGSLAEGVDQHRNEVLGLVLRAEFVKKR